MLAQDGDAFPVAPKSDMRPVCIQIIALAQLVVNDLGGIGGPVPTTVPPSFTDLLQTDDIDIEVVDGPGYVTELRLLIFFLVAMQVQRENFQSPAAGYVVVTEIVVPDRCGGVSQPIAY